MRIAAAVFVLASLIAGPAAACEGVGEHCYDGHPVFPASDLPRFWSTIRSAATPQAAYDKIVSSYSKPPFYFFGEISPETGHRDQVRINTFVADTASMVAQVPAIEVDLLVMGSATSSASRREMVKVWLDGR